MIIVIDFILDFLLITKYILLIFGYFFSYDMFCVLIFG